MNLWRWVWARGFWTGLGSARIAASFPNINCLAIAHADGKYSSRLSEWHCRALSVIADSNASMSRSSVIVQGPDGVGNPASNSSLRLVSMGLDLWRPAEFQMVLGSIVFRYSPGRGTVSGFPLTPVDFPEA